jgi:hypothetical protein
VSEPNEQLIGDSTGNLIGDIENGQDAPFDRADQSSGGSRLIGRILPAAVRLWLRSQVEQISDLSIRLAGRDRQIIGGYLPSVELSAERAIYRGIYLTQAQLSAQDIRINVGQVIRGQPLRLLKAFSVLGKVTLSAEDLNASLASVLLIEGLRDFWRQLTQDQALAQSVIAHYGLLPLQADLILHNAQIGLGEQCLALSFYPQAQGQTADQPVILGTGLDLVGGDRLQLTAPRWLASLADLDQPNEGVPIDALEGFQWDLGKDTQLTQLVLQPEQLACTGQIRVNP